MINCPFAREIYGSEKKDFPAMAARNQSLLMTDNILPSASKHCPCASVIFNSTIFSLKATSFARKLNFAADEEFTPRRIGIREIPSINCNNDVTLPLIISAVSFALSIRWASIFSVTAFRAMTTAKTISIIPAAAIKIPKMRISFFLKEKRFLTFSVVTYALSTCS